MPRVPQEFWPIVLATDPPALLTREEAYRKVPHMKVLHIPATIPRNEDGPPAQVDILADASQRGDSYGVAALASHGRFGGFLLHRSALQRRISTGFTSGLSGPRSFGRSDDRTKEKRKQAKSQHAR